MRTGTADNARARLRVAVVAPPWFEIPPMGYGGIERVCYDLVQGLVELGHEVTLVAAGSNHTNAKFVPVFDEPAQGLGTEFHSVQEVRYAAGVAQALSNVDVDIIHDHSLAGPLVSMSRPIPTLLTAHGPTAHLLGDYFRRLALPLIAISEFQRRSAPDLRWISTIPHGIDVDRYPYRPDKDDFLLFLGRLSAEKGAHLAIDAARKAGVRLIVAGKMTDPAERRYFEEYVAPRMGPDMEFIGETYGSQRSDLLSRARGMLAPSQWNEPFGLAVVEALACGTPVIGLRRGSLPEIIDHGLTGWICEDLEELTNAIRHLAQLNPQTCRAVATERYRMATMVERYENAYRRLLAPTA